MSRRPLAAWLLFLAALLVLIGLMGSIIARASKSEASVPTWVSCSDEWQHPTSGEAKTCRERGWMVTTKYVVTPGRVPVFLDLPSCKVEDGTTNYGPCSWNVNAGDGNGKGLRYLVVNVTGGKRYVYLRECFGIRCHRSQR